jgi:hypothetical protein
MTPQQRTRAAHRAPKIVRVAVKKVSITTYRDVVYRDGRNARACPEICPVLQERAI